MQLNKYILTLLIVSITDQAISDGIDSRSRSSTDISNNSDNSLPTRIDPFLNGNDFVSNIISQFSFTPTPTNNDTFTSSDINDPTDSITSDFSDDDNNFNSNLSPTDFTEDNSNFNSNSSTSDSSNDSSSNSDFSTKTRHRSSSSITDDNGFTTTTFQRFKPESTITNTINSIDYLNSSSTIYYTYTTFLIITLFAWLN